MTLPSSVFGDKKTGSPIKVLSLLLTYVVHSIIEDESLNCLFVFFSFIRWCTRKTCSKRLGPRIKTDSLVCHHFGLKQKEILQQKRGIANTPRDLAIHLIHGK
ncbi:hypothetical protein KJ966_00845 [bacterium]|nr:hypothetical protein [bacterium]